MDIIIEINAIADLVTNQSLPDEFLDGLLNKLYDLRDNLAKELSINNDLG